MRRSAGSSMPSASMSGSASTSPPGPCRTMRPPSMTAIEWARATADQLPVAARPMRSLADLVDRVTYAPPGSVDLERVGTFGATVGQDSELWADQIDRIALDTLSPAQRIRRYFTVWR